MNPDDGPEKCSFVEYSINYIRDKLSTEDVYSLLTDDNIWEDFVAQACFSREEAEEVRDGLKMYETLKDMDEKDMYQQEREFRERFLKEFPQMKKEVERHIAQLRALADKADKVHRDCTISNLVASSTSIVSGILTIAGLGLAPVTAGVSLGLSATGLGLGAVSAVTGVTTSIVEHVNMTSINVDANKFTSTRINPEEEFLRIVRDCAPKIVSLGKNVYGSIEGIKKNIHAINAITANPDLAAQATCVTNSGSLSAQNARQVQEAFGGTALTMSKGARMAGMATAGLFLLADVYSLVKHSAHLQEGAKTESARRLREQAAELEMTLENLQAIQAALLED